MLKIYGADLSTPANKVRMVANFLNLDYEYIQIKIREGEHKRKEFLKINPIGKIPAMDDDGFMLFESGAICRYLIEKSGESSLFPRDIKQRAVVDAYNEFAVLHIQAAMNRIMFNTVFYKLAKIEKDEKSLEDGINFMNRFLPAVENRLGESIYFPLEDVSLADITLLNALDPAEIAGVDLSAYSKIIKWRQELKKTTWYQQCHVEYGLPLKKIMESSVK